MAPKGGRNPFIPIGMNANLTNNVINAMKRGWRGAEGSFRAFGAALEVSVGNDADVASVHSQIARNMLRAARQAYARNVRGDRSTYHSYARPGRLHGGMERALARPDQAIGNANGIFYVNSAAFREEAAHWRRLNFGAGSIAGERVDRIPLNVLGRQLFKVGFRVQPAKPFYLPPGFFFNSDRNRWEGPRNDHQRPSGRFSVSRRSTYQPQITRGIKGKHFLEVGVDVLAEDLGPAYATLLDKWIREADERGHAALATGYRPS